MKINEYQIGLSAANGPYDCIVEETYENNETYYHIAIQGPTGDFQLEMHFDTVADGLKFKSEGISIPDDILKIEDQLSDLICGIHN